MCFGLLLRDLSTFVGVVGHWSVLFTRAKQRLTVNSHFKLYLKIDTCSLKVLKYMKCILVEKLGGNRKTSAHSVGRYMKLGARNAQNAQLLPDLICTGNWLKLATFR